MGVEVEGVAELGVVATVLASSEGATGVTGSVFTWFAIVGAGGSAGALF